MCALGREEGEDVVIDFLAGAPEWRAADVALALPSRAADVGARILPSVDGLDGFYVALLERAASGRDPAADDEDAVASA